METGVKPRYDGKGTEFGLGHRELGPGFLMMDIDRLSANVEMDVNLNRENEGFFEYRIFKGIQFVAMYELKHSRTSYSERALDMKEINSVVRTEICKRLNCRCFVVFATEGKEPFDFFEIIEGQVEYVGRLTYTRETRTQAWRDFYRHKLKIGR